MDRPAFDRKPRILRQQTPEAPLDQYDLERRRKVILREALAPGMDQLLPPWTGEDLRLAQERAANVKLPPPLYPNGRPE